MKRTTSWVWALLLGVTLSLGLAACGTPQISFEPPQPTQEQSEPDRDAESSRESGLLQDSALPEGTQSIEDAQERITPDEEGYALGYLGDVLRTEFFDMRVDSARTCMEFDGVVPDAGKKLLVAEITLYNYTDYTQPMFNTDFEIWWDEQEGEAYEDAWDFPVYGVDEETGEYYNLSDQQLPVEWEFPIHETRTGTLLYQVPEGSSTYSVAFMEYFEDGTTGNLYEVRFSAPMAQ